MIHYNDYETIREAYRVPCCCPYRLVTLNVLPLILMACIVWIRFLGIEMGTFRLLVKYNGSILAPYPPSSHG